MIASALNAIRIAVYASIIVPLVAWAVVDPGQPVRQPTRFTASAVAGSAAQEELVSRLIVKPRRKLGDQLHRDLLARDAHRLSNAGNVSMSVVRQMSGNAHVINLDTPVTLAEAHAIAGRLMSDSSVEFAEPDRRKHPLAVTPTDPNYAAYQWNLFIPAPKNLGSANLPNAWSITEGSNAVTVAVIDTGYRPHADLGSVVLPGYTFISDAAAATNGYGRGPDAQDTGDWITAAENTNRTGPFYACGETDSRNRPLNQLTPSSWHGTHVTGIVAAQISNGIGIAGIAPNIRILPVRVLGKCGGYDSDILDGMRWAAGMAVAGVPANPHPAQVLNMSLGGSGGSPCSAAYQSAINELIAAGKVLVVAAGNDNSTTLSDPANCTGVIAVTANSIDGDNSWYSTIGTGTTISAPGGDCGGINPNCNSANYPGVFSLVNSGTTTPVPSPGGDTYAAYSGTSMATPHVAAVAALMLSLNSSLTPAQITSTLRSTARAFPPNTICTETKFSGMCGAGLLDAYQALSAARPSTPQTIGAISFSPPVLAVGGTTTVNAIATSGLPVIFSSLTTSVCSVAGTTVAGVSAGACTIGANQTGNGSFAAAPQVTQSFPVTSGNAAARSKDFNGDGKSDILWYNAGTGQTAAWLMNGSNSLSSTVLLTDPNWKVAGTGDFNGDGMTDILWYNESGGQTAVWLMNGTGAQSGAILLTDPNWRVIGTGDFNGDGKTDILWYNASAGQTAVWFMSGTGALSGAILLTDTAWKVIGTGDFNGDGKTDILWYNASTGQTAMWLMNGASTLSNTVLLTDPNWRVIGTGDLNGDGKTDILWYNASAGQTAVWLMNGASALSGAMLLADPNWKVAGTGDFNGDGRTDILWYSPSGGQTAVWLMNGTNALSGAILRTDPSWNVTGY